MKKLLIVAAAIYPDLIGGISLTSYHLGKFFKKKPINLAFSIYELYKFDYKELSGFRFFPIPKISRPIFSAFFRLLYLFRNLVVYNPDAILCLGLLDYALMSSLYARLFRKKVIIWTTGTEIEFLGSKFRTLRKLLTCRIADQITCVSPTHIPVIEKFKPKNTPLLVVSGTELPKVDLTKREKKDHFMLLFVGRLDPVKNVETLLHGFKLLIEKSEQLKKGVYLTICSDGPLRNHLEKLSKSLTLDDNVIFAGRVDLDELGRLYEMADIFVLPSLSEGFPLVIEEALSYGCPIVCSKLDGIAFFLKKDQNCLFYSPPKNSELLGEKLLELLNDDALRKEMCENNLALSRNFSWDKMGEYFWELVKNS